MNVIRIGTISCSFTKILIFVYCVMKVLFQPLFAVAFIANKVSDSKKFAIEHVILF